LQKINRWHGMSVWCRAWIAQGGFLDSIRRPIVADDSPLEASEMAGATYDLVASGAAATLMVKPSLLTGLKSCHLCNIPVG
jgi:hypothetical protein